MAPNRLEARSKRLANDICKIVGARPTHGQLEQVIDAIHAEFAPQQQATNLDVAIIEIIKALPELLADYEHCALDADGKLDSNRARSISTIRRQVEAALK